MKWKKKWEKKKLILLFQQGQDYSDQPGEDGKILFVAPEMKTQPSRKQQKPKMAGYLQQKNWLVEETIYCIF